MPNTRRGTRHPNRMPPGVPHPVDVFVGGRVRIKRKALGLSQTELGNALGLTFQQVQKYERGANRIGASRLYQIGSVLGVPVSYFFEDMDEAIKPARGRSPFKGKGKAAGSGDRDLMGAEETTALIRAYYDIPCGIRRKAVHDLIAQLSKAAW